MEKDQENRIEELARQKLGGKSYGEIRAELKSSGMSEKSINELIRQVDDKVLANAVSAGKVDMAQRWYRSGLILAVLGLALSIAFNAGLLLKAYPPLMVYAPFIAGILLMFYGKMLQRQKPDTKKEGPSPIRRKRPYK